MGGKYSSFIVLLGLLVVAMAPANAGDAVKSGTIERNGSKFSYRVIALTSKNRRIEVTHSGKEYTGALAEMSFRDRHLQVFEMVARLIKTTCQDGVSSLGNIWVSKDPEQDEDPEARHPQYFMWEYSCK
ncbi:UNVERIFIED_ORG: hypothetical protein GGD51_005440 [Rhizobium esperanzae]|uniref:hypothetical protein n=1 Tax=Rhizobium phaseoli TaxID=396 RepID=UPI0005639644|nr:hypothetical protein [Rhizobium phaseoli]PWI54072.1 hypothetical protein B5K03_15985 [Rhizobium phaseoli]